MKLKTLVYCFVCTVFTTLQAQDLLITELTDPQNSSDAGRYVEIYNPSPNDIDLSEGFALQRWTNAAADPQSAVALTGIIPTGGYYVVCNDAAKFSATYGVEASQHIGTGGPADSNGDDNVALIGPDGSVVDIFGVPGEDGSGTGHEFEDGRAERACGVLASSTWNEVDWNVDNDSGGGDGNQYAPEGFDPFSWANDGTSCADVVVNDPCAEVVCLDGEECVDGNCVVISVLGCTDSSANNYNADATEDDGSCNYDILGCTDADANNYSSDATADDGSCTYDISGCTDSTAINFNPDAVEEDGSCDFSQAAPLFFSEYAEGSSNNKYLEIFNPTSEAVDLAYYAYPSVSNAPTTPGVHEYWNTFDSAATIAPGGVYIIAHPSSDSTILALADETHGYLSNGDDGYALAFGAEASHVILDMVGDFNGDPGSAWEVAGVSNATKDHTLIRKMSVTSGNTDWASSAGTSSDDSEWIVLDQDTWDYLGSHQELSIPGCTDSLALNYDEQATADDGSCIGAVEGCMDEGADNYNPEANTNDGSCFTTTLGCIDSLALNFDSQANTDDDSCIYDSASLTNALSLQGVLDIGLSGSGGKAIHLVALSDIADLSLFGFGVAGNGEGSFGQSFSLPQISASAGDQILLASSPEAIGTYFADCAASFDTILYAPVYINGDDAIELNQQNL
ncbi:MAG: lamin tail domain-containing protein, partial [Candidatus Marinimicrobia bacterium]|nr:lamin tail domain-containing protein [Candidatus Neomarinimicrobiota bacterium]